MNFVAQHEPENADLRSNYQKLKEMMKKSRAVFFAIKICSLRLRGVAGQDISHIVFCYLCDTSNNTSA